MMTLGDRSPVAERGSVSPHVLLPGLLDEPLLLARDAAGTLRCLSNVCTHRAKLLVDAPGRTTQIRCGYHSRRFDLDGRLRFMPGMEGACDFPSDSDHLPQLALGQRFGQAFVSLHPAVPLAQVLDDIETRMPGMAMADWVADPARSRSFEFDAHWALYVENYLEGLHIPFLHPGLTQTLAPGGYRYELFAHANLQLALARDGESAFEPPPGHRDHGLRVAAYYWWVFPNLMLNVYPWGLSLNLVQPLGPARTRVLFRSFVADASRLDQGAGGALDPVEMEDEAAVLSVQRGVRSRLYRPGRLSPQHERGVHHFHRLLAAALADGHAGAPAP
jgi:choline monooxygenase